MERLQSNTKFVLFSCPTFFSVLDYTGKKISNEEMSKNIAQYSVEEILLLNWLQYHFELQRSQAWMMGEDGEMIQIRTVSNFEKDLADSLVLIAVTAAYCPYLINEHFSNLYIPPRNIEEVNPLPRYFYISVLLPAFLTSLDP